MLLFIDAQAARQFTHRAASPEYGEHRRYYCGQAPYRASSAAR